MSFSFGDIVAAAAAAVGSAAACVLTDVRPRSIGRSVGARADRAPVAS
jgi:hypothetical protein